MKRSRKLLLTVLMLLTLIFAASITTQAATAAKIGNKKYSSLQKAVNAVKNGQTIKVMKNITAGKSGGIEIDKKGVSFTIDFQKHTYKATAENYLFSVDAGSVTLKNAKFTGYKSSRSFVYVEKGAKLTILSGTYNKIFVVNDGTLTIKGGTFSEGAPGNMGFIDIGVISSSKVLKITGGTFKGKVVNCNGGKATISGGTFTYGTNEETIDNSSSSTMTITGGKFTNTRGCVLNNAGTLTVKGGTFTSAYKKASLIYLRTGSMTKLKGGIFIGKSQSHLYYKFTRYSWSYAYLDISNNVVIKTPYMGN